MRATSGSSATTPFFGPLVFNKDRPAFHVFTLEEFRCELETQRKSPQFKRETPITTERVAAMQAALDSRKGELGFVMFRSGKIIERNGDGMVGTLPENIYDRPTVSAQPTAGPAERKRPSTSLHSSSDRELLLQYEALRDVPAAQGAFYDANESALQSAAEKQPTAVFSDSELARARAEHLKKADALLTSAESNPEAEWNAEMAVAVAIVEFAEQKTEITPATLNNSPRNLLLQHQALADVPVAQAIFFESHEQALFEAAKDHPEVVFSEAELAGARAALSREAKAIAAQSQHIGANAGMERTKFLDSNDKQLTAAIAILETYA